MDISDFYTRQDGFTDPGTCAGLYDDLPKSPAELRDLVSQLIIHVAWGGWYGVAPGASVSRETLTVGARLKLCGTLQPGSLRAQRPPGKRSFGTCRDYSVMLCSMLRHHAIPARVRCGFATYFTACPFEDHWICEYWSAQDNSWKQADAQLDQMHRERLGIGFDPADLPDGAFLTAAQAWQLVRSGGAASEAFGQGDTRGVWFIRVDVYRDLLALTNRYTSAWDTWRNATAASKVLGPTDLAAVDAVAEIIGNFEAGQDSQDSLALLETAATDHRLPPWPT